MSIKGTLRQNIRIILAIAKKDIIDGAKNKTTISVLFSALFLFFFYMLLPTLEQEKIIDLYDAGHSAWLAALDDSNPFKITYYDTQEALQYHISRRGEQDLGLILPVDFDQAVATGDLVNLQGYLLNWISEKQASQIIIQAEEQIAGVVGVPVDINVERLFMLPESTGTGLNRGVGSLLLILMAGVLLIPHLMLEEKRSGTIDALLVSPASAGMITIGKALTGLFFCFLGFCLVSLFNTRFILQWWLVLLAGIGATLFSVSLGLLLGALIDNRQKMLVIANLTIFPLLIAVFLSIESEFLPAWLGTITRWIPTTVAFDLFRLSFTPQASFGFIAPRIAVILLVVIVLLSFVAWRLRRSDRM